METLVELLNFYAGKNYFLFYRHNFLQYLIELSKNIKNLDISYKQILTKDKYDDFEIKINDLIIRVSEFGNSRIIKGSLNEEELRQLYNLIIYADGIMYKIYSKELENRTDLYETYAGLIETLNNFRLTKEHLKLYLNAEIKNNEIIFKDGKNKVIFKLLNKKMLVKDIWKTYGKDIMKRVNKIKELGFKFDLGRVFSFKLKKSDIKVEGDPKKIIKDINNFLSNYFSLFNIMNLYKVNLNYKERGIIDVILLKKLKNNNVEASNILRRNKGKNEFTINDEEKQWLLNTLKNIQKKVKGYVSEKLYEEVKNSKLIKVKFKNKSFFEKIKGLFKK